MARKAKKAETGKSGEQGDYEKKLKNNECVTVEDVLKLTKITEGKFKLVLGWSLDSVNNKGNTRKSNRAI